MYPSAPLPRRTLLRTLAAAGAVTAVPSFAQNTFPNKPIRIIAAGAAGGGLDLIARLIVERLQRTLKQPFIIENKPGGNGVLAANSVLYAAPDGYTLLLTSASFTVVAQAMPNKLAYDVTRDLTPVALVGTGGVFLVVSPSFPAKNMKELVELIKAQPDKHTYASFGVGSAGHLVMAALQNQTGMKLNHVPYKGLPQIYGDLMNGTINIAFVDVVSSMSLLRAGKFRALAVSGTSRMPASPDVPTMSEQGFKFDANGWFTIFAPKGTPAAIVTILNQAITNTLAAPELQERLQQANLANAPRMTPVQLTEMVSEDLKLWMKIVQDNNISAEE